MMDTSEPYIGAMKGTMREPQANLGASQNISPVNVFKQKKKGVTNPGISVD